MLSNRKPKTLVEEAIDTSTFCLMNRDYHGAFHEAIRCLYLEHEVEGIPKQVQMENVESYLEVLPPKKSEMVEHILVLIIQAVYEGGDQHKAAQIMGWYFKNEMFAMTDGLKVIQVKLLCELENLEKAKEQVLGIKNLQTKENMVRAIKQVENKVKESRGNQVQKQDHKNNERQEITKWEKFQSIIQYYFHLIRPERLLKIILFFIVAIALWMSRKRLGKMLQAAQVLY